MYRQLIMGEGVPFNVSFGGDQHDFAFPAITLSGQSLMWLIAKAMQVVAGSLHHFASTSQYAFVPICVCIPAFIHDQPVKQEGAAMLVFSLPLSRITGSSVPQVCLCWSQERIHFQRSDQCMWEKQSLATGGSAFRGRTMPSPTCISVGTSVREGSDAILSVKSTLWLSIAAAFCNPTNPIHSRTQGSQVKMWCPQCFLDIETVETCGDHQAILWLTFPAGSEERRPCLPLGLTGLCVVIAVKLTTWSKWVGIRQIWYEADWLYTFIFFTDVGFRISYPSDIIRYSGRSYPILGRPRQVYNSLCSAFEKGQKWRNILELLSGSGSELGKANNVFILGAKNDKKWRTKCYWKKNTTLCVIMSCMNHDEVWLD